MAVTLNDLGQPVGALLRDWKPPPIPAREMMSGVFCRVEPLDTGRHGKSLFEANALDREGKNWTYLSYGPFASFESYREWLTQSASGSDPMFFAIIVRISDRAVGVSSYLRIVSRSVSIEVGRM